LHSCVPHPFPSALVRTYLGNHGAVTHRKTACPDRPVVGTLAVMGINSEILDFYDLGLERERLTPGRSLELIRTQVLLKRFLPEPPARVLEVGGASGVYSSWLAGLGYDVDLIDPVPLHIEQARAIGGFSASLGDARHLEQDDDSYDAVLLLGPLYHLTDGADRIRAFEEAARVTRPGGLVIGAAISRYASTLDGYFRSVVDRPGFVSIMRQGRQTGQHRNPGLGARFFTTAYFHHPDELAAEVREAGLLPEHVLPVEGPLNWAPDIADRLEDPEQRAEVLAVLADLEQDPAMTAATSHLLAVARVS
jgi:SAM-dependent methyltransferase